MAKNIEIRNSTAEFLIFMLEGQEDGIQVMYKDETIWATKRLWRSFLMWEYLQSANTLKIFLRVESWAKIQLFPKWKQLQPMVKITTRPFIISMPLSVSVIV